MSRPIFPKGSLDFPFRTVGKCLMFGALIAEVYNGFEPSWDTKLLLWLSIKCFIWDKP